MSKKSNECSVESCGTSLVFGTEFKYANEYDTVAKEITWRMQKGFSVWFMLTD